MKRIYAFFFLMAFLFPSVISAQGPTMEYNQTDISEKDFDRSKWEQLTKEVHYDIDEKKKKESEKKEEFSEEDDFNDPPPFLNLGNWSVASKIILIGLFVALITFIIYQTIKNKPRKIDRNIVLSDNEIIEQIEDNIQQSDIDSFLNKAIAEGNYSLAIRLQYLNILKSLSSRGIIKWKKDKTNRTYLSEIKEKQMKNDFRHLTNVFERVWYGNIVLQKEVFETLSPVFEMFSDQIKNGTS